MKCNGVFAAVLFCSSDCSSYVLVSQRTPRMQLRRHQIRRRISDGKLHRAQRVTQRSIRLARECTLCLKLSNAHAPRAIGAPAAILHLVRLAQIGMSGATSLWA